MRMNGPHLGAFSFVIILLFMGFIMGEIGYFIGAAFFSYVGYVLYKVFNDKT